MHFIEMFWPTIQTALLIGWLIWCARDIRKWTAKQATQWIAEQNTQKLNK